MTESLLSGSCGCKLTTWSSSTAPSCLDFCYCETCRRTTGAPFGSWMGINRSDLSFSGPVATTRSSTIAVRSFCGGCGGTLTIQYDCYPGKTHVAAGTADKGLEHIPNVGCHLFVGEKVIWYQIPEDGVPRWEAFDEEFPEVLRKYEETKIASNPN